MKKPKYLYRKDDGERFTLGKDGEYSMDKSEMLPKYTYRYENLIKYDFVDSPSKCKILKYKSVNDGHGNGDFDE